MPEKQLRIELSQTDIERTGYKIADLIEHIKENKNAVLVRSIAFEHTAPDGEKLQVQVLVTRDDELKLSGDFDKIEYE